ncbi:hypothetical protein Bhyg_06609 [Pseudolycoriella hygida]|uniref:Uncharacterized protein n=1 Tax=Pseudolycoriella hygida TaxID=35572 RepID=A0A9Q0S222_9DIPT|nr:hypothetical protein Bhyg_06609 [Pseudolycoriella hygida]
MTMMDSYSVSLILGFVTALLINNCGGIYHQRTIRALDFPTQWRPLAVPAQNEHLISIANFDSANKAQLAQIAHHNAQILRQIKGLHPPITQYHNPYPMFATGHGGKNVFVHTNIIHPSLPDSSTNNLLTSSSNVAHTIVPNNMKNHFVSPKPSFMGKTEMKSPFKFLNSVHTSTAKIPGLIKGAVSVQPSFPIYASTTSRVPIIRDVTLTPPPSYRTTPKSHPVVNKMNAHLALSSRTKTPVMSASNSFDAFSIPGQILNSFANFAQPSHVIRDNKPRISNAFLNYQVEQPFSNSYSGHLVPAGHFISKPQYTNSLRYPQNSVSSVYSPHSQHTVLLKHPSPPVQSIQQLVNNQHSSVQYEKPKEQHLTETFHSQTISHDNPNRETETQYQKPVVESEDHKENDGAYLPPLPSVPPSVLSPFFQNVQQQQLQSQTSTEPQPSVNDHNNFPNAYDLYKSNKDVQFSNFKALENEFTHNLVPPPFKHKETSQFREKPQSSSSYLDVEQIKALDILNKYNIPAISPLQDANRFAYNSRPVPSTETSNVERPSEKPSGTFASFTTEKPNIFQNLNRAPESEYKQHKLMHPGYTGAKRPVPSTHQPFLPTPQSHDIAITHSFFTIEDAITLSPKHSYDSYRPILPTKTDQIEEIIRKPVEEEITEVVTLTPINNNLQETVKETSPTPTLDTSTRLRGRGNKIRRRKPKPSTEANDEAQGQWETFKNDDTQNGNYRQNYNEAIVEEKPNDEMIENVANFNRNRHRIRPSSTASTIEGNMNQKPSRGRRPLNKTRHRTSSHTTPTGESPEDNEQITMDPFVSNYNYRHRRPSTTTQTFSSPSAPLHIFKDVQTTDPVTIISDVQTNEPMRTKVYTTAMSHHNFNHDVTEPLLVNTPVGNPEENFVILSTKAAFSDNAITNTPESETTINYRQNTFPVEETVIPTQQLASTTSSSTTTSSSKISEDVSEKNGLDHLRHRQRLRYKEKLKDAASSTTSTSTTTEIFVDKTVQDNEVTDNRMNVRLPTSSSKASVDDEAVTTPALSTNKLHRLNAMNKFNRPRFSVKDYRQKISTSSTTTEQTSPSTESTTLATTRLRFPTRTRLLPDLKKTVEKVAKTQDTVKSPDEAPVMKPTSSQDATESTSETTRKRFSPKDRYTNRAKTTENPSTTTNRSTTRSRGSSTRRDFGHKGRQSSTTPSSIEKSVSRTPIIRNSTYPLRRPQNVGLRQRIQNHYKTTKEPTSSNEVDSQTDMTMENKSDEISTEDYKRETAIMKIAKDDHSYRPYKASDEVNYNDSDNDLNGSPSEQSERVAELAIFDNSFNSVHTGSASRRIPGYFTIATEDPILPIEAFFPQVKRD